LNSYSVEIKSDINDFNFYRTGGKYSEELNLEYNQYETNRLDVCVNSYSDIYVYSIGQVFNYLSEPDKKCYYVTGNNSVNFSSAFASTSIEKVPDIKCTSGAIACTSMFSGCTKLIDASTLFDGSKPTSITMTEMFKSCSNLIYPPSGLSTVNEVKTATSAFEGCSKLPEIDLSILLKGNEETTKMFANCESLTTVTNGRLSEKLKNAADMFSGCKNLKSIPRDFFPNAYTNNVINIENMFNGCTELEITLDASKLWENTDIQWKAVGAFKGCVNIKNYDDIPLGWK
jgi:hypothetical protein